MRCDVAPLTFEQYRAGAPCPGCGLPYVDSELFDFKGTINLSDAERVRYDAEESRFKAAHASCRSHSHSISGFADKALRQMLSAAAYVAVSTRANSRPDDADRSQAAATVYRLR
jgi:hypothetical protein